MIHKRSVLVLGFFLIFTSFASERYVHAVAEKNVNELTIFAHRNEVIWFQTVMPERVRAQVLEGESCAVEAPIARLVGKRKITSEARIVPHTMGNPADVVCRVLFTDGTYQTSIRILYR